VKVFNVIVKVRDSDIANADMEWLTDVLILKTNSSLDNIVNDLNLPVLGINGSDINWISSNEEVAAPDGTVTRPSFTKGNQTVALTAEIRKGSVKLTKSFNLTVVKLEATDSEAVSLDYTWLTDALVLNGNSDLYNITKNLNLPVLGPNGSAIVWTSTNEAFAAKNGTIIRPTLAQGSQDVMLTAEISRGSVNYKKYFFMKVTAEATDIEAVTEIYSWLTASVILNGNFDLELIEKDLKLPVIAAFGAAISWASSDEAVIAPDGKVTRPSWTVGRKWVTLTANISKGTESKQKQFLLAVQQLAQTDQEAINFDTLWLGGSRTLGGNLSVYSVTQNLSLPASAYYGSSIQWTSDKPEIISDNGVVTRPEYKEGYRYVTLTAVLSKGEAKATKSIVYTVLAKPDTFAPVVINTTPVNNSTDILWNTRELTLTFDENIKRGTLAEADKMNSFGIQINGVGGIQQISAGIDKNKLIITPLGDLGTGENVLLIPKGAVTDTAGNPVEEYRLSFSVEKKESNKIEVVSSNPENMARQVPAETAIAFSYSYSKISKGSTFSKISLHSEDGKEISTKPILNGSVVTLNPSAPLKPAAVYKITIPASAVMDRFENSSSEKTILFRTMAVDQEPEVTKTYPLDGQKNVDIHESIEIGFSDVMKAKNCKLKLVDDKGNLIKTYIKNINNLQNLVLLEPSIPLKPNTRYTVSGPYLSEMNPSELEFSMSFTTGANLLRKLKVSPSGNSDQFCASINTPVEIEFSDDIIKGLDFSGISISDSKGNIVSFKAEEKGSKAVLTSSSELAASETYTVNIPWGAYEAAGGSVNDAFKFEFTTAKPLEPDTFTVSPYTTWLVNKPLKFNITAIEDIFEQSEYVITSFEWNYGDGSSDIDSNPTHIYTAPGNYQVTLRLQDNKGFSYELKQMITIENMDLNNIKMSVGTDLGDYAIIRYGDNSSTNKLYKLKLNYNGSFVTGETIRVRLYKNGVFQKDFGTITAGANDNDYLFRFYYAGQGYLGTYELAFECESLSGIKTIRKSVTVAENTAIGTLRVKLYDTDKRGYVDNRDTWEFEIDGQKKVGVKEWYNDKEGYCYFIKDVYVNQTHTIKVTDWFPQYVNIYCNSSWYTTAIAGRMREPGIDGISFGFTDKRVFNFIEGVDTGDVSFIIDGYWNRLTPGYYEMKTESGSFNLKSSKPVLNFNAGKKLRAGDRLLVRMVSENGSMSPWKYVSAQVLPQPSLGSGPRMGILFKNGEYHINVPMGVNIRGEGIPLLSDIPLLNQSESFGLSNDDLMLTGKLDESNWITLDFNGGAGYIQTRKLRKTRLRRESK